jgi:hypothetical protein
MDAGFGNWLAGFIDGEGCFLIAAQPCGIRFYPRFQLKLRADDRAILDEIQAALRIGNRYDYEPTACAKGNDKAQSLWSVTDQAGCVALVAFLDEFPLRAKKARDYAIWREAVHARTSRDWRRMLMLRGRLIEARAYDAEECVAIERRPDQMILEVG